jgi:hypothetical protein
VGSDIIPSIEFLGDQQPLASPTLRGRPQETRRGGHPRRGGIRGSRSQDGKKRSAPISSANPATKAFPADNPAVYELYWSPGQVKARAHPNMLEAQRFLLSFWHAKDPAAAIDTKYPVSYADRLRIRQPGDAGFALGAHVDGGSVERWEPDGLRHRRSHTASIFAGQVRGVRPLGVLDEN